MCATSRPSLCLCLLRCGIKIDVWTSTRRAHRQLFEHIFCLSWIVIAGNAKLSKPLLCLTCCGLQSDRSWNCPTISRSLHFARSCRVLLFDIPNFCDGSMCLPTCWRSLGLLGDSSQCRNQPLRRCSLLGSRAWKMPPLPLMKRLPSRCLPISGFLTALLLLSRISILTIVVCVCHQFPLGPFSTTIGVRGVSKASRVQTLVASISWSTSPLQLRRTSGIAMASSGRSFWRLVRWRGLVPFRLLSSVSVCVAPARRNHVGQRRTHL